MFGKPRKSVREELEREGVRALATVLDIAQRGMAIQKNGFVAGAEVALKTTLRVQPPDGGAPFEVRQSLRYSQFAIPSVGSQVHVIYDAGDHDQLMLDRSAPVGRRPSSLSGIGVPEVPVVTRPNDPVELLAKAAHLHAQGVLTDAEFAQQKARILGQS